MISHREKSYNRGVKIILAPFYLHKSLFAYFRKDDPFCDIKIISKEELQKFYYPAVLEGGLLYLMQEKGYNYETAIHYLRYVPYVYQNHSTLKLDFLSELHDDLVSHDYFYKANQDHNIYKNKDIDIYGYDKSDIEVERLLQLLNANGIYHHFERKNEHGNITVFTRIEDEVYSVLNQVAGLLANGTPISDIYLFRRNKQYDYFLKKFAPTFGYQVNLDEGETFFSLGAYKEFDKLYKENHDIDLSLDLLKEVMQEEDTYPLFMDQVNGLKIEGASFEVQYDYLSHRLKEKRLPTDRYDNALEVIDEPIYASGKHIFILGFAQGQYPASQKDSSYLGAEELHEIYRNNYKDITRLDGRSLLDFFNSDNHFYFSFANKDIQTSYYLSPLAIVMNMKTTSPKAQEEFYSNEVLKYIYCDLKDLEREYDIKGEDYYRLIDVIDIEYNNYENQYQKVNAFTSESELNLSTTALDKYSSCPFAYYLERVLKLDQFEGNLASNMGNISHEVFEHVREPNFDFNRIFKEEIAKYTFKNSELFLLNGPIKNQLQNACNYILKRDKYMSHPRFENEISLVWNIDDKTKVVGKIDSLIFLDDKYFICVDYKTGSKGFERSKITYGMDSQLPTYAILVKEDKRHHYQDYECAGYFLNHVITSSIKETTLPEDKLVPDYFKLTGLALAEIEAISKIDSTIADETPSFIAGVKISKKGELTGKKIASKDEFLQYETTIRALYQDMANRIRNNDFVINPLYVKDIKSCDYCNYGDVCFVKAFQRRVLEEEEKEDEQSED